MTLALVLPVWQRPALTRAVVDYYASLCVEGVRLWVIYVASLDDPAADEVPGYGQSYDNVTYAWAPNEPLSDKFNAGFREARDFRPDAVILCGSDDLLSESYFEAVRDLPPGVDYYELGGAYFYDLPTARCGYTRYRVGSGRLFSRRLLERCDWMPYASGLRQNVDSGCYALTSQPDVLSVTEHDPAGRGIACVALKSETNLWTFQYERRRIPESKWTAIDGPALLRAVFPTFTLPAYADAR